MVQSDGDDDDDGNLSVFDEMPSFDFKYDNMTMTIT